MYNVNLVVYLNLLFVNNLLTNEYFVVKITKFLAKYLKKRPMSGYFFFKYFKNIFGNNEHKLWESFVKKNKKIKKTC